MLVARDPSELQPSTRAVALGTFDGVHSAHRNLISRAVRSGLRSTVITFEPHPRLVLGRPVKLISSLARRLELIESTGASEVLVIEFTTAFVKMSPAEWIARILRPIGTRRLVIGANYRFGHGRAGDAETLRRSGFAVDAVPLLYGVSSTVIRDLVRAGDLTRSRVHLGRPHELEGKLGPADESGSAPLSVEGPMLLPPSGIYVGRISGRSSFVSVDSAASIRVSPAPAAASADTGVRVQLLRSAEALTARSERGLGEVVRRPVPGLVAA